MLTDLKHLEIPGSVLFNRIKPSCYPMTQFLPNILLTQKEACIDIGNRGTYVIISIQKVWLVPLSSPLAETV